MHTICANQSEESSYATPAAANSVSTHVCNTCTLTSAMQCTQRRRLPAQGMHACCTADLGGSRTRQVSKLCNCSRTSTVRVRQRCHACITCKKEPTHASQAHAISSTAEQLGMADQQAPCTTWLLQCCCCRCTNNNTQKPHCNHIELILSLCCDKVAAPSIASEN
jgi:hypothetical protein